MSPLHFGARQPKYYDAIDRAKLEIEERRNDLAEEAQAFITNQQPDKLVGPQDYGVEETHFDRMESGLKWWSVSNTEKLSTPLGEFKPPFTLRWILARGLPITSGSVSGGTAKSYARWRPTATI